VACAGKPNAASVSGRDPGNENAVPSQGEPPVASAVPEGAVWKRLASLMGTNVPINGASRHACPDAQNHLAVGCGKRFSRKWQGHLFEPGFGAPTIRLATIPGDVMVSSSMGRTITLKGPCLSPQSAISRAVSARVCEVNPKVRST